MFFQTETVTWHRRRPLKDFTTLNIKACDVLMVLLYFNACFFVRLTWLILLNFFWICFTEWFSGKETRNVVFELWLKMCSILKVIFWLEQTKFGYNRQNKRSWITPAPTTTWWAVGVWTLSAELHARPYFVKCVDEHVVYIYI